MSRLEHKHPRVTRWLHWLNVPLLAIMIWSGLLIYWANNIYRIGFGETTLVKFFPQGFFHALGLEFRLGEGMAWHFAFMWLFALNGLIYVAYTIFSGEWRHLLPTRRTWLEAVQVTLHDLHLRSDRPPQGKYNAAQRIAYSAVIGMGAGSLLTGLVIYKPVQLGWLTTLLGGYEWARWEHFWLMIGYVVFTVIHLIQVVRAGWGNFRSMVTGYDLTPVEQVSLAAAETPAPEQSHA